MNPERIKSNAAFQLGWYYRLELAPGLFTPGVDHAGVVQTRDLLERTDAENGGCDGGPASCLDIGLQEGMIPLLLARRGVNDVLGYDRALRTSRLNLVESALDHKFDLIGGMSLQQLPAALKQAGRGPFDLVVFSGVAYHMFDPMGGLAVVRGLVRDGGICVFETTVAFDDSDAMFFNSRGRFTPQGLWFMTPSCVDYLLRFVHFEPLDAVFLSGQPAKGAKPAQGRIAVACRAVPDAVSAGGDEWISAYGFLKDFAEFLDWEALKLKNEAPPVGYNAERKGLVRRDDGSLDIGATVAQGSPLRIDRARTNLGLGDKY